MNLKKQLLITGFLLMGLFSLTAQNYLNVFNTRYYIQPGSEIEDQEAIDPISEFRIEAAIPFPFSNGNILGLKPQYKKIRIKSSDGQNSELNLHTFKLPIFSFIEWKNEKWSSYFDISPKLNSDLENITAKHFQIGCMNINYYEKKENFFWQFGFFYNQDTYGPFFMPLFGIDWKMNDKDYLALLLPAYMMYERRLGQKIYTGFEMELSGETFRLGGSDYKDSYISQLGPNRITFMVEPHLFLDYYITRQLVIYLKPGFRFLQKYEHYTDAPDFKNSDEIYKRITESEYIEGVLKNNFYLEMGMALRFRYDDETP